MRVIKNAGECIKSATNDSGRYLYAAVVKPGVAKIMRHTSMQSSPNHYIKHAIVKYCHCRWCAVIAILLCLILSLSSYSYKTIRSTPQPLSTHHTLDPENEPYATYVNNLQKCLDTINLTDYFRQRKFLSPAVANMKYYVDTVHKFIPRQFNATLPNHCWDDDIELVVGSSYISGHIGRTQYNISRTDIDNDRETTLCVFRWLKNYQKRHVLPFSCIPEVFMAGFPKCGTTYMHTLITSHPAISDPIQKEPFWWDRTNYFSKSNVNYALYMADYLANFESLVKNLSVTRRPNLVISMDGTSSTLYNWPRISGPKEGIINICLLPAVLPEILPKLKFIIMMRNPVAYLYSHFWFTCTMGEKPVSLKVKSKGPDIFHDRVLKGIASFHSCIAKFPLAKCGQITEHSRPFNALMPSCGDTYISIALYYVHIHKWLSVVPREKWLFVTIEELSTKKIQTLNRVWDFLSVPPLKEEVEGFIHSQVEVDYHHRHSLAMRNDTREVLKKFFRPYNQMLADLLGDRKFLWEDD